MIVADNYIHYYFQDSGIAIANYSDSKAKALASNYKRFKDRYSSISNNPNAQEMINLYQQMANGELEKELQSINDTGVVTGAGKVGSNNMSMLSISRYLNNSVSANSSIIREKAQNLINDLSSIIKNIDSYIEDFYSILEKNYPKAKKYALNILAANNNFSGDGLTKTASRKLVDDALNKNMVLIDNNDCNESESYLAMDYVRLKQRVEALRTLKSNPNLYSTSKTGKIIGTLVGKIGGTFSDASGRLEEIIVAKAANEVIKKVGKSFNGVFSNKEAFAAITGSGDISIEIKNENMSPDLAEIIKGAEANDSSNFNKNDVSLVIRDGNIVLIVGISVKKTLSGGSNNSIDSISRKNISVQTTSLKAVLDKAKSQMRLSDWYIYNVASGHVNKEDGDSFSNYKATTGIHTMWRDMVKNAVYLNFLDYLVGEGGIYSNSALLIANRQVYTMDSILQAVTPESISISGGLDRNKFVKINEWVGSRPGSSRNQAQAMERSSSLGGRLDSSFASTIVKVKLNLTSLAL